MQTSRGSANDGQGQHYGPGQPPHNQGGPGYQPGVPVQTPVSPHQQMVPGSQGGHGGPPSPLPRQPQPHESHIGNVTIFRTAQFFVHAVRQRTAALRSSSGNTTLLEQIRWVSTERQRVLQAETRLLPQIDLINPIRREITIPGWFEAVVVVLAIAVAMAVHMMNIFGFPQHQPGEGLLMAHAWSVSRGSLAPFGPYTFEQNPFGWIFLAGWSVISGGFTTFGSAINSGRALMLAFAFGSSLLIYLLTGRMSGSRSAGLLAMLLFALSPLGIDYHRQVMLENMGTFWLLLSLFLLIGGNSRLPSIVFSGVALGLAILTQGVFVIFIPVMLYTVWLHATPFQRKFALVAFTYIALSLTSAIALFALLSSQLLPGGSANSPTPNLWDGINRHVQTTLAQSNFLATWEIWMAHERLLFIASGVAILINALGGVWNRVQWLAALLLATMWVFILTTGIIFPSYFIILLPLMAINVAIAANFAIKGISQRYGFDLIRVLLIFLVIGALTPFQVQAAQTYGLTEQNRNQERSSALSWIRENVPQDATIIINSDLFVDLHTPGGPERRSYEKAYYYQNELFNPERPGKLNNKWEEIDYIVLDAQMQQELRERPSDMSVVERALHSAKLVKEFQGPQGSVKIYQIIPPKK